MIPPNLKLAWLLVNDCSCRFSMISRHSVGNTHFLLSMYGDNSSSSFSCRINVVTANNTEGISKHMLQDSCDWLRTWTCTFRGISETNSFHETPASGTAVSASICSCESCILQMRCSLIGTLSFEHTTFHSSSPGRCSGSISAILFNMRRNDLEIIWVSMVESVLSAMMSLYRRVKFVTRCFFSSLELVISMVDKN